MATGLRVRFWRWAWTQARHLASWCFRHYKAAETVPGVCNCGHEGLERMFHLGGCPMKAVA